MILLLLAQLGLAADLVDGVACTVNDRVITYSDIYALGSEFIGQQCGSLQAGRATSCTERMEAEIAKSLILDELIRQKLDEVGLDMGDDQLEGYIAQLAAQEGLPDGAAFRAQLEAQGMIWEEVREQIRKQARMQRFQQYFLAPKVTITEEELLDTYRRATRDADQGDKVGITYLLYTLPSDTSDMDALTLKAALAEAVAEARASGAGIGGLGPVEGITPRQARTASKPDELSGALLPVLELEEGDLGGPYRVGNAFMIARLDGRSAGPAPFEQVRDRLEQQLMQARIEEELEEWYAFAVRNAAVDCTYDAAIR